MNLLWIFIIVAMAVGEAPYAVGRVFDTKPACEEFRDLSLVAINKARQENMKVGVTECFSVHLFATISQ